jgi:hypothetical protein
MLLGMQSTSYILTLTHWLTFFWHNTAAWIQGFKFARQVLYNLNPCPFGFLSLLPRQGHMLLPRLASNLIPPISTSGELGIIDVHHHAWSFTFLLGKKVSRFFLLKENLFYFKEPSTTKHTDCQFFFFFGSTGAWTQGLTLARQVLLPLESLHQPFLCCCFLCVVLFCFVSEIGAHICPGWLRTMI